MDVNEYINLADGVYEFTTYMDEKIVGIPTSDIISGKQQYFIIPISKITEFNTSNIKIEEKLNRKIVELINPDVIDIYMKIQ